MNKISILILIMVFAAPLFAVNADWAPGDYTIVQEVQNGFYHLMDTSGVATDKYILAKPIYADSALVGVVSIPWKSIYTDLPEGFKFYKNVPPGYIKIPGKDKNGFTQYYNLCAKTTGIWHKNIKANIRGKREIVGAVIFKIDFE